MAEVPEITLNDSQFLHVTIDVPTQSSARFMACMEKILPQFTNPCPPTGDLTGFGWELVASMTRKAAPSSSTFLNLWKMTDPARPLLFEVMAELGTDNDYGELDQLVDVEIQDILHTNDEYSPANWPADPPRAFVHETLDMTADGVKLAAFSDRMPVIAEEARQKFGWQLLVALMSNTGRLRRILHLWQVGDTSQAAVDKAAGWLTSQPAYAQALRQRTAEVYDAVQYGRTAA